MLSPGRYFFLHVLLGEAVAHHTGALILDRLSFSASGHRARPGGGALVSRSFTERELGPSGRGGAAAAAPIVGKTVVLLQALEHMRGAHDVELKPGWGKATVDGAPYNDSSVGWVPEPVRIHHYVTRSHAECVAKITLGRWPDAMDWRKTNGRQLCDSRMEGNAAYDELRMVQDYSLAGSRFPDVVRHMVAIVEAGG